MRIIVPSLGRAGTSATMKWLREANRPISFAIHRDEVNAYALAYPDCDQIILSDGCKRHTGKVRQEILKYPKPFIFVDDDIRLSLKANKNIEQVFDVLEHHIDSGASIAGLGQQLFSNGNIDKTVIINGDPWAIHNQFVATVYAINPKDFEDCPLEQLPVYEDVALVIHGIRKGGTITSYVATHTNVSPPTGGCNSWRSKEITLECLNKLVDLYPGICSIRPTNSTTHSQYLGVGLRVAWSKIK